MFYLLQIVEVVDKVVVVLQVGGCLIYIGVGILGCLGIFDVSECLLIFGICLEQVVGIIVGGYKVIFSVVENVEDNKVQGVMDLQNLNFSNCDVLVGLVVSGCMLYVIGVMEYVYSQNVFVVIVSCNLYGEMVQLVDVVIILVVGLEVVIGFICLKVGIVQKLVLNMIFIGVMICVGKVYSNLMVDVEVINVKLIECQVFIVMEVIDCDCVIVQKVLEVCGCYCKMVIVMVLVDLSVVEVQLLLVKNNGYICKVFSNI